MTEKMLGWRPLVVYKYLWKYVCLLAMLGLLGASLLRMVLERPTYTAWNQATASEMKLDYPDWALAVMGLLIIFATLPVPLGYLHATLKARARQNSIGSGLDGETGRYTKCSTVECDTHIAALLEEHKGRTTQNSPMPLAEESCRLLSPTVGVEEEEEEEEEDSTGL